MRQRLTASVLVALASSVLLGVSVAPAVAADTACINADASITPEDTTQHSAALERLGIVAAQDVVRRAAPPSKVPIGVAVLGSGVRVPTDDRIPVIAVHSEVGGDNVDPTSTIVAGLIAGAGRDEDDPIGVAPAAKIIDVRVYVDGAPDPDRLAAGLDWVVAHRDDHNIKIATVGFTTRPSDALRKAVQNALDKGLVVVAASGDRLDDESEKPAYADPHDRGEDGAQFFYPAGYPGVVVVNSTSEGSGTPATDEVVRNSRTTVAAPTFGAVSYGLNGATCLVNPISTAAAAGEVSGVLALLFQVYRDDTGDQAVARLVNTASGTVDDPTPLVGAGVVQPYEALTRPLAPSSEGAVERTVTEVDQRVEATAPEPESDLLARTRENAVWWGLIGGGVLVVALLLRPVLARRRITRS